MRQGSKPVSPSASHHSPPQSIPTPSNSVQTESHLLSSNGKAAAYSWGDGPPWVCKTLLPSIPRNPGGPSEAISSRILPRTGSPASGPCQARQCQHPWPQVRRTCSDHSPGKSALRCCGVPRHLQPSPLCPTGVHVQSAIGTCDLIWGPRIPQERPEKVITSL